MKNKLLILGLYLLPTAVFAASGELKVVGENICIDIPAGTENAGVNITQYTCHGGINQDFSIENVGRHYSVRSLASNLCLSANNTQNITQEACGHLDRPQGWLIEQDISSENFKLKSLNTNECIGALNNTNLNEELLVGCDSGNAHLFDYGGNIKETASRWSSIIPLPLTPAAGAHGRGNTMMFWSAYAKNSFAQNAAGKTQFTSLNLTTKLANQTEVANTNHDMFCPGTVVLGDGRLLVTGGDTAAKASLYDPVLDQWSSAPEMIRPRGYHSMTPLSDGGAFTLGGSWSGGSGAKHGEIWDNVTETWIAKPDLTATGTILTQDSQDINGVYRSDNHMWLFQQPDGDIIHFGPAKTMHRLSLQGDGSITNIGERDDDEDSMSGTLSNLGKGEYLKVGGSSDYQDVDANSNAYLLTINNVDVDVDVEKLNNMEFKRAFHNSVTLPNGEVIIIGGQKHAVPFSDATAVFSVESWSPTTKAFTTLSSMDVPRTYHSVALLSQSGEVVSAGGGLCGGCATNHPDAQIFTPPYLFNDDGSSATRPSITGISTTSAFPASMIEVSLSTIGEYSFVLMRKGAATHTVNNDMRRIELTSTYISEDEKYQVFLPSDATLLLAGNYFLFALNNNGVPSIAKNITINPLHERVVSLAISDSNKCLDIEAYNTEVNTQLIQYDCTGNSNQKFKLVSQRGNNYSIHSTILGKENLCLGVSPELSMNSAAPVVLLECQSGENNQIWSFNDINGHTHIKLKASDQCMNIYGGSSTNLTGVIQYACDDTAPFLDRDKFELR